MVTYEATGYDGSPFTWSVTGGTFITGNTGNIVTVRWDAPGTGSITVEEDYNGCIGKKTICVSIIEKPIAQFLIAPDRVPPGPGKVTTVCLQSPVQFVDLSTSPSQSPIISWYWDFGDGTYSTQQSPPNHTYTSAGNYVAKLVVKNACNCTDTFRTNIEVVNQQGPDILCSSIACEGGVYTYYTTSGCTPGDFIWSVSGGEILQDNGNEVDIIWNNPQPGGLGYLSLANKTCGICPSNTTIKVPIVMQEPEITGSKRTCINKLTAFSIPLWPGTIYEWGVLDHPGLIHGTNKSNEVVMSFPGPGTYQVHIAWKNTVAICGGDITFEVEVVDDADIEGPVQVCGGYGNTVAYQMSTSQDADWVLEGPFGVVATHSGASFDAEFPDKGIYRLYATGEFCSNPLKIEVDGAEPVENVEGQTTVCAGKPYTYTASPDVPGAKFVFNAVNGTLTLGTNNTATVVWHSFPAELQVKRVNNAIPFCESDILTIGIEEDLVTPNVTGPDTVCPNSYHSYTANYNSPNATYKWTVEPELAGSVQAGTYNSSITFLSNHFTIQQLAKVIVEVNSCDTIVRDTVDIVIRPTVPLVISAPDTICSGDSTLFTATPGAQLYQWNFGEDEDKFEQGGNARKHVYWNATEKGIIYKIEVTAQGTDGSGICPPDGRKWKYVYVKPGPSVVIGASGALNYSLFAPISTLLIAVPTVYIVPIAGFQWLKNGIPIPGATSSTYTATSVGAYTVVVQDATGCKGISNRITIDYIPGHCTGGTSINTPIPVNCGFVTPTATAVGSSPRWYVDEEKGLVVSGFGTFAPTIQYFYAGRHYVTHYTDVGTCTYSDKEYVDVPLVQKPYYNIQCSGSGYSVVLEDRSSYMVNYGGTTRNKIRTSWEVYSDVLWTNLVRSSGGFTTASLDISTLTPGATYYIKITTELVDTLFMPNFIHASCFSNQYSITMPVRPVVSFTKAPDNICEGIPVSFQPSIAGSAGPFRYLWNFGDGTQSTLENTYRVYDYNRSTGQPLSTTYQPTLTVTDGFGCTFSSASQNVIIWDNLVTGTITGALPTCNGPVTIGYVPAPSSSPAVTYTWAPAGGNTSSASVAQSGIYAVTVEDAHRCRFVTPTTEVVIHKAPQPEINGRLDICEGEQIELSADAGPDVTHEWKLMGSVVATGNQMTDMRPPGTYNYTLALTYAPPGYSGLPCAAISGPVSVTVHPTPSRPSITGMTVTSCLPYEVQLAGSHSSFGALNWSNGTAGNTTRVSDGGLYRLWYTSPGGCTSHADTTVPPSPEHYFQWFPSGCLELCSSRFPFNLYGPPGLFGQWQWTEQSAGTLGAGINSAINPQSITGAGTYALGLNTGLCTGTTAPFSISTGPSASCGACGSVISGYSFNCDNTRPGGYIMGLTLTNSYATNTIFTIGLTNGPGVPFQVSLPPGTHTVSLNVAAMQAPPIYIEVGWKQPGVRSHCYERVLVDPSAYTYPCPWPSQKYGGDDSSTAGKGKLQRKGIEAAVATGMLLYPNPAAQMLQVSYRFAGSEGSRYIAIFDASGRKVKELPVTNSAGTAGIDVSAWMPGVYLVRMVENGAAVHTQHLSIAH